MGDNGYKCINVLHEKVMHIIMTRSSPQIDDQIALLINAWCELLVFSCCYRSVSSPPGVIRVSNEKSLTLSSARQYGIEKCVEKMLNFTDQLRRLKVDYFEYVSMKVIVLLTSGMDSAEGHVI